MTKKKVAIVGSGNWGCAIAKIVGTNAARHNHLNEEVIPSHSPHQASPPPRPPAMRWVLACRVGVARWRFRRRGRRAIAYAEALSPQVRMWVFEEMVGGRKLTDIINEDHENVKYMPGIKLPRNVVADPDVVSVLISLHVLGF